LLQARSFFIQPPGIFNTATANLSYPLSFFFNEYRQMAFLSGPRQVGKTTTSRAAAGIKDINTYMNWDKPDGSKDYYQGS